jgi:trehalose 6-phosphate synthase/phosphatase
MERRLFIVSNRLPITIDEENGIQPASGGLITAINGFMRKSDRQQFSKVYWAGVPGCSANTWTDNIERNTDQNFTYLPVFIKPFQYNGYYNGHANSLLWPLFHYFPSYAEYNVEHYEDYCQVNEQFSHALLKHLLPGDTVWIHDYHLLALPQLLRNAMPELTIGFFLHIPFPSYEIFRLLPRSWQQEHLKGLLGADLIGFHTIDYASHFLQSIQMTLGLDNDRNIILYNNRLIKVDVFPISVDFDHFHRYYDDQQVVSIRESMAEKAIDKKIIFSVDRLDYTKGVNNRLKAYEHFLANNPQYYEKVIFILAVVPSRDNIGKYKERKQLIDQTISQINSSFGSIQWQPVIYQYHALPFDELMALYTGCDLALITPLRDGMNLVAKEFVASRKNKKGVLVLSEMAGAARELSDAIIINPNDIVEMADAIKAGLEMPEPEQATRLEAMQNRIANYDVKIWAEDFLGELQNIKKRQQAFQVKFLDEYSKINLLESYRLAKKRLLLLDYDGTLKSFVSNPADAIPGNDLLQLIKELNGDKNTVCLISGRSSDWLEKYFGDCNIHMVAEHGARFKYPNQIWTNEVMMQNDWKKPIQQIMQVYVRRCAHSFIEEKEFSIVWHYRNASLEQGKLRSAELLSELNEYAYKRHLQVSMGNKIVEVKANGVDKGIAIKKILNNNDFDFILAIGDDYTDEDMFKVLLEVKNSYTIKVGNEASFARYNLFTPQMVISLLENMNYINEKHLFQ